MFQSLQQWPKRLSLAGRAKSAEAIAYFQTNHKCKQLISGWLYQVPGEFCDNEHLTKNFRHFCNYLISEDKFGVCKPTPDNNITLYIFPIAQHREFAEKFIDLSLTSDKALGVLGIIKRQMSLRRNFLNPTVYREPQPTDQPKPEPNKRQKKIKEKA